jgi:hypothetical protein
MWIRLILRGTTRDLPVGEQKGGAMKLRAVVLISLAASVLTACGGEESARPAATDQTEIAVQTTPFEGTWRIEQTKEEVAANLERFGFEELIPEFMEIEGIWEQDIWEYDYEGEQFTGRWLTPDRVWKVGIRGIFEVDGDTVRITEPDAGNLSGTTYSWTITGDQLQLEYVDGPEGLHKGIPFEAYDRAYFTPPMTRVH